MILRTRQPGIHRPIPRGISPYQIISASRPAVWYDTWQLSAWRDVSGNLRYPIGSPVGLCPDLSGGSGSVSQATDTRRPTLTAVNGRPFLQFDGGDILLPDYTFASPIPTPWTIIQAIRFDSNAESQRFWFASGILGLHTVPLASAGTIRLFAGVTLVASYAMPSAMTIISITSNEVASRIRANGVTLVTGNAGTARVVVSLMIGGDNNTGNVWFTGLMGGAVLLPTKDLSRIAPVERALGAMYGVTISA